MATEANLALTTLSGSPLNIDTNQVVWAFDNADTNAVLTYETDAGFVKTETITISSMALNNLATQAFFIESNLDAGGVDWVLNNTRVVNVFDVDAGANIYYNTGNETVNRKILVDNTASGVSDDCNTIIPITQAELNLAYYISGAGVRSMVTKPSTLNNKSLTSATLVDPGTGWIPTETFQFDVPATTTPKGKVDTTQVVALTTTPGAAGTSYNVGDTVNPNGGTGTKAVIAVTHIKFVALPAIAAAGNGYNVGDTFTLTTGTGTQETFTVATLTAGAGSGVATFTRNSLGNYTVRPTLSATAATAHTSGTGNDALTLVLLAADFGALTVAETSGGSYTVNPTALTASATTAVTGVGTGMTITFSTGINTFEITDPGVLSATPTNPIPERGASGSGTGATFNGTFTGEITQIRFDDKQNSANQTINVKETIVEIQTLINALP